MWTFQQQCILLELASDDFTSFQLDHHRKIDLAIPKHLLYSFLLLLQESVCGCVCVMCVCLPCFRSHFDLIFTLMKYFLGLTQFSLFYEWWHTLLAQMQQKTVKNMILPQLFHRCAQTGIQFSFIQTYFSFQISDLPQLTCAFPFNPNANSVLHHNFQDM